MDWIKGFYQTVRMQDVLIKLQGVKYSEGSPEKDPKGLERQSQDTNAAWRQAERDPARPALMHLLERIAYGARPRRHTKPAKGAKRLGGVRNKTWLP